MKKAIEFIKSIINKELIEKEIRVYGWQNEYNHLLISSVGKFLFEDFTVIDNLAPLTNENRPANVKPKFYITVHDTGDSNPEHTALFWSDTVKNEYWEQGKYACSYQYVVGNDGTYRQIPDNEVAWHAGDTTKYDYALYDAFVEGDNPYPVITIGSDGYFEIDGKKSQILAPRVKKEKDGKVIIERVPTTKDINDQGVLCKLIDGKYYLGEVYFNETYMLIANRGGNNNSIGIESCVNENTDIYYTWQKTAKLVAHLLKNNNLSFEDVKQHHYYSGKNCPQTIRMNGFWDHFMELVRTEYQAINFINEGYSFKIINHSENILPNGRVLKNENLKFSVEIIKDNKKEVIDFNL